MYSSSSNISCSIDNITNLLNLSWDNVDHRYDFINFNFKKLLSTKTIIKCIVSKILYAMHIFGNEYNLFI